MQHRTSTASAASEVAAMAASGRAVAVLIRCNPVAAGGSVRCAARIAASVLGWGRAVASMPAGLPDCWDASRPGLSAAAPVPSADVDFDLASSSLKAPRGDELERKSGASAAAQGSIASASARTAAVARTAARRVCNARAHACCRRASHMKQRLRFKGSTLLNANAADQCIIARRHGALQQQQCMTLGKMPANSSANPAQAYFPCHHGGN